LGARVVLLTADLLFGSKVEAMIRGAGAEPVLVGDPQAALDAAADAALLIVDLTADAYAGTETVAPATPTIGFYAHTDDDTRRAALANGFAQVVPRSRMVREGAELIRARLAA